MDDGLFRRVAKADVVEGDLAVDGGRVGTAGRISQLVLLFLAQKFKHTFRRGGHALQHVGYLRQLLDGLGEVFDVLDERLDVTDGDSTGGSKNTARHSYGHVPQVAHKVHDGLHQAGEELAFPRGFVQFIVGSIEICQHGVLPIESLDDIVAGVDLLDLAIDNAQRCLLRLKIFLAEFDHQQHQRQRDRQDQQCDQRHFGTDGQHHDEHADHGGHAGDQLCDRLVQALAQGVHIVGDAGEHFAHGALFKIGQRQAVDLFTDLTAEIIADFLGQAAHQPALDKAERRGQQVHAQQDQQNFTDVAKVDGAGAPQLGDPASGQGRGGLGENFGACYIKYGRQNGKNNDHDERKLILAHRPQQLQQAALKVFGALGGHASGSWHITRPPSTGSILSGSADCGRFPDTRGSFPSAGRGYRRPRCSHRPIQGCGWHAALWRYAGPQ